MQKVDHELLKRLYDSVTERASFCGVSVQFKKKTTWNKTGFVNLDSVWKQNTNSISPVLYPWCDCWCVLSVSYFIFQERVCLLLMSGFPSVMIELCSDWMMSFDRLVNGGRRGREARTDEFSDSLWLSVRSDFGAWGELEVLASITFPPLFFFFF